MDLAAELQAHLSCATEYRVSPADCDATASHNTPALLAVEPYRGRVGGQHPFAAKASAEAISHASHASNRGLNGVLAHDLTHVNGLNRVGLDGTILFAY